eukprot:765511-Rhodomonas_salina.1
MHCKPGLCSRYRPKNARLPRAKGRRASPDRRACLWCVGRRHQSTRCQNLRYNSQVRACTAKQASAVETDPKTPDCSTKKVGEAHLIDGLAYGVLDDAIGARVANICSDSLANGSDEIPDDDASVGIRAGLYGAATCD